MLAVAHGNSDNGDGLLSAVRDRTAERTGHDGTVQLNLQLGADRLNSAVEASPILAMELDTTVGFWVRDGRLYLVRNLMDSSYDRIGTLSLVLDTDYFFGDLALLPWVSAISVSLAPQAALTLKGEIPFQPRERILEHTIRDRDYTLYGTAAWDYAALSTGAKSYRYFDRGAGCPVLQHSQPGLQASG